MDLGKAIIKDIEKTLSNANMKHILEATNKLYKESMEQLNLEAKNPDGKPRTRLTTPYAKRKAKQGGASTGFANFVLTGREKKSLNFIIILMIKPTNICMHMKYLIRTKKKEDSSL